MATNDEEYEGKIYDLVERADRADGAEKVALLDEAVRLADLRQDAERATYLRQDLFEAAFDVGQYERALAEFNTMIATADRHADSFGADVMDSLLWRYKWVAEHVHKYPSVSREQVETMFREMERRYREAGLSMRAVYALRSATALDMGDKKRADEYFAKWLDAEEDGSEDCPACELNAYVEYLLRSGEPDEAINKAKPLLAGEMRCAEVPGITHSVLLVPLLRRGEVEQAARGHKASYRQMRETRKFVGYAGNHLQYLALINDHTRAVKLLESRLAWALETRNGQDKFTFLLGARLLLARLAAQGRKTVKLLLPPSFEHTREDGQYDTSDLAEKFLAMASDVAKQFDRRNGTDRYLKLLQENEALIPFETPVKQDGADRGAR
jgi:hypothetical protein